MSTHSVILKKWTRIPHLKVGEKISGIIDMHKQDIFTRLRRQNGIVFEDIDKEKADAIANLLTKKGFPALSVSNADVCPDFNYQLIRNADVLATGLEIEDPYGKKTLVTPDIIGYIHAGYVEESLKDSDGTMGLFGPLSGGGQGAVEGPALKPLSMPGLVGWVLHMFVDDEQRTVYRIIESKFYYDYQGEEFVSPALKFAILLSDIIDHWPDVNLDDGIGLILEKLPEIPLEMKYDTLENLEARLRWAMTAKSFIGE